MVRWHWCAGDVSPWPPPAGRPDPRLHRDRCVEAGPGQVPAQACDQRTCVWRVRGSKVHQVSPTGRNGHHCFRCVGTARSGRSHGMTAHMSEVWNHPCDMCQPQKRTPGFRCRQIPARGLWDGLRPVTVDTRHGSARGADLRIGARFWCGIVRQVSVLHVTSYGCPDVTPEGVVLVCVRFLRTQQRAKNRCQV